MVFDGHSDLLYDVTRRHLAGERQVLARRHLARLRRGGVEGLVLAVWTDVAQGETFWAETPWRDRNAGWARTEQMLACAQAELAACEAVRLVRDRAEAEQARAAGRLYAFLSIEGMDAIGRDLRGIGRYAAAGARMGMLTWNGANALATGSGGDMAAGLTALGRQAVAEMERHGMLLDVSHLNDGGFWEALDLTHGPVIASHSNCRSLCDVSRNLTDDQLRAIRDTGGVVGLNAFHRFVHADRARQTAEMLARHAAHMVEVMGVDHVACGFDFCHFMGPGNEGAAGLEDASGIGSLFDWLERLGMSRQERQQIARENFLRVLDPSGGLQVGTDVL